MFAFKSAWKTESEFVFLQQQRWKSPPYRRTEPDVLLFQSLSFTAKWKQRNEELSLCSAPPGAKLNMIYAQRASRFPQILLTEPKVRLWASAPPTFPSTLRASSQTRTTVWKSNPGVFLPTKRTFVPEANPAAQLKILTEGLENGSRLGGIFPKLLWNNYGADCGELSPSSSNCCCNRGGMMGRSGRTGISEGFLQPFNEIHLLVDFHCLPVCEER